MKNTVLEAVLSYLILLISVFTFSVILPIEAILLQLCISKTPLCS